MSEPVTLTIDIGDLNKLPIGWIDEVEDACDASIADILGSLNGDGAKVRRGKALRAIGLLQLLKTNPDATWADTKGMVLDQSTFGTKPDLPPPPSVE